MPLKNLSQYFDHQLKEAVTITDQPPAKSLGERLDERPLAFCALCNGVDVAPLFQAANVWKCPRCGLIFRKPRPRDEELSGLYRECYSPRRIATGSTGQAGTTLSLARRYVRCLSKLVELRGKKVLDFGAGLGTISLALMEYGADVIALDPFAWDVCERVGIRSYSSLSELPEHMRFDGVVAIDVLEHVPFPWDTLQELRKLLVPDGWIYVSTLTIKGLNALIRKEHWREILKKEHLTFFTPRTLERMLKQAGFQRCTRLKWFIRYSRNPARITLHFVLQLLALEGELRYLAQ